MKIKSLLLALLIAITSLFGACDDDDQEVDEPVAGEQMVDMGSDCTDTEEVDEEEVAAGEEEESEEEELPVEEEEESDEESTEEGDEGEESSEG